MSNSKVLLIMTGSIACYKTCNVISKLRQLGHDVQVVATESALKFVGIATLEGLSGNPVLTDLWANGQAMNHIDLVRSANLILVAPASASFINKMAAGIGEDLATTLCLAHDFSKPFLVVPAMNSAMYAHPSTQNSLKTLATWGIEILPTNTGLLACGETGQGRVLEPEQILAAVLQNLAGNPPSHSAKIPSIQKVRVLVTAGGTQEPIDAVRVITNRSTGSTGVKIAKQFVDNGAEVTLLRSKLTSLSNVANTGTNTSTNAGKSEINSNLEEINFSTFKDLYTTMHQLLTERKFDIVIHAAAVSDFSIDDESLLKSKISSQDKLTLRFKTNPKIINEIKNWAPLAKLVAFKMTADGDPVQQQNAISKLFLDSKADFVVHNDVAEIPWGNSGQTDRHHFHWYRSQNDLENNLFLENVSDLAELIASETLQETL